MSIGLSAFHFLLFYYIILYSLKNWYFFSFLYWHDREYRSLMTSVFIPNSYVFPYPNYPPSKSPTMILNLCSRSRFESPGFTCRKKSSSMLSIHDPRSEILISNHYDFYNNPGIRKCYSYGVTVIAFLAIK